MSWEEAKPILRPQNVHMGRMKIDKGKCTKCGLCILNCPFKAWEKGKDGIPQLKAVYECFSCYNCAVACKAGAVSIDEIYHVDDGFYATTPPYMKSILPLPPKDAQGKPDKWNPVEQLILERRSQRNFKKDPVPEPLIQRILEAGRFAPSAGNGQPWKFTVITNKEILAELDYILMFVCSILYDTYMDDAKCKNISCLVSEYLSMPSVKCLMDPRLIKGGCGYMAKAYAPASLNAPCVIIISGDDRCPSGPELNIGICGENMNIVASSLGIGCCWVGFYALLELVPRYKEMIGIKPPYRIVTGLALGYTAFNQSGMVPRLYNPITWYRDGSNEPQIQE